MKNALILHGTNSTPNDNWFPWLKTQLEERGYAVWSPQLPHAEKPNIQRYNKFLFGNENWRFDPDSVLIGHSSGAVAILGLLQALPPDAKVGTCILVGAFKDDLHWDSLKDLFIEPLDFAKIRQHAQKIIFVHSDDDPHCPLEGAEYLKDQLHAQLLVKHGQKHFSIGTAGDQYREFPLILDLLHLSHA